jgi:putative transposase
MPYDPHKHRRRSIRVKGFDYSQAGLYFVTICVQGGERVLGQIQDGVVVLSAAGKIVEEEWLRTAELRDNVELDAFVVMPNHFHAIVCILDDTSK